MSQAQIEARSARSSVCRARSSPSPTRDDRALVESVWAGDDAAFTVIYRSHHAAVTREVRARIADGDAVADLVQEVFIRALHGLRNLRDPSLLRPWLLSIARHVCMDDYRARSRRGTVVDDEALVSQPGRDPGPEELAELDELASMLRGCIRGLTKRDATALALVTYFNFTIPQLAAVFGISTGAAKVMLHRARRRLRDALVLRLLAGERDSPCGAFDELWRTGAVVKATEHAWACDRCRAVITAQVQLRSGRDRST